MNRRIVKAMLLLAGIISFATGWTDLDWMIVTNHFQFDQGGNAVWEFCPYLKLNWWLAYEFSIFRIIAGCLIIGWFLYDYVYGIKVEKSEAQK